MTGGPLATPDCYARLRPMLRSYLRRLVPADDVDDVVAIVEKGFQELVEDSATIEQ